MVPKSIMMKPDITGFVEFCQDCFKACVLWEFAKQTGARNIRPQVAARATKFKLWIISQFSN